MKSLQVIVSLLGFVAISIFGLMASYPIWTVPEEPMYFSCGVVDESYPEEKLALPAGHMGLTLFENNCTVCHAINHIVVGPALRDAHLRMDSVLLRNWIMNSQEVIQSGDEYAVALYNEYNNTQMPTYSFTDEQLTHLIEYIRAASGEQVYLPVVEPEAPLVD